jgi:hypothetical protein
MASSAFPCPRCEIGLCRPGRIAYAHVIAGQLLSIPNLPAHVCDVCGYREIDSQAVHRLRAVVGEVGLPAEESLHRAKTQSLEWNDVLDSKKTTQRHHKP